MKKKKDVLFLCQFFYPEYISSATLPFDTAQALHDSGKSVGVLCGYPKEYSDEKNVPLKENYKGIEIQRVKYIQLKRSNFFGRIINYFSFTLSILFKIYRFKDYKTVVVYSNPPVLPMITALANYLFKTKIIFVSYDIYPEIALETGAIKVDSVIHKTMKIINKITFPRFSKVISLSSEMKEFILNNRENVSEDKIEIIPNWYEKVVGNNEKEVNSYENPIFKDILPTEKTIISYFGNMGIAQDMETIYRTIQKNASDESFHFIVAGHGSKKEKLKKLIAENKLTNVTVYDFLKGKDYQDALDVSDALIVSLEEKLVGLCVPSKTYGYYSAGKPIIAILDEEMDISKEIIRNHNGFVIKNNDIDSMQRALEEIKNKNSKEMGINSLSLYKKNYTKKIATKKYIELIDSLLEG